MEEVARTGEKPYLCATNPPRTRGRGGLPCHLGLVGMGSGNNGKTKKRIERKEKMRLIIIDSDPQSCAGLWQGLARYADITVDGVAHNGTDGLALIDRSRPDAVLLGVEPADEAGLTVLERSAWLRESKCPVVVSTANGDVVLHAMRKKAYDVLPKPVDSRELEGVVGRLRDVAGKKADPMDAGRYVLFTNSVDFTVIGRGDVGLFQYDPDTRSWEAVVAGLARPVKLRRHIKGDRLKDFGHQFVRVHQRFIINTDYLQEVVDARCRFLPPFDHIGHVVVGRVYRGQLLDRFQSL